MTIPKKITHKTPIATIEAKDLVKGATIIARSGSHVEVREVRKRNGCVRVQFVGKSGVAELPRMAPVNVYTD